jgi:hypothetical protein
LTCALITLAGVGGSSARSAVGRILSGIHLLLQALAAGVWSQYLLEFSLNAIGVANEVRIIAAGGAEDAFLEQFAIVGEPLDGLQLMVNHHHGHINVLGQVALEKVERRVASQLAASQIEPLIDQRDQPDLP